MQMRHVVGTRCLLYIYNKHIYTPAHPGGLTITTRKYCVYTGQPLIPFEPTREILVGPQIRVFYQKIIFFFSQPKHMLWVIKRTVSLRLFF